MRHLDVSQEGMKKEFEKFIIWYLPFCFVTAALTTFLIPYLTKHAVESYRTTEVLGMHYTSLVYLISNCHKLVAAVWLWKQKKKENGRFILWAFFGYFQGLWAVAFYIALSIFEEFKTQPKPTNQTGANQTH